VHFLSLGRATAAHSKEKLKAGKGCGFGVYHEVCYSFAATGVEWKVAAEEMYRVGTSYFNFIVHWSSTEHRV
jgi:hypothetical protein